MGSSTKAATSFLSPPITNPSGFSSTRTCCSILRNGHLSFGPISPEKLLLRRTRRPLVVEAKKGNEKENKNKNSKPGTHSFGLKQDETTGPFPEAVLLKEKKVKEDGRVLPEFADAEEEELFEFLNLQLESDLNLEEMRHYEVVYLIHQDHKDEVEAVNSKIQDFLREKQGRVWRFSDWGMRRLAYKIKKATHARYILMNLELPAQWTDEFKSMLDKDERVIRHLVRAILPHVYGSALPSWRVHYDRGRILLQWGLPFPDIGLEMLFPRKDTTDGKLGTAKTYPCPKEP
ncbi:hypothetical protein Cgig2_026055 [Carnegiea gigantea]|uniref:Ribosomal protein S6 n=1 Tax=Carnegiea gigantea TaxID=171969 RepID=A0A9Q1KMX9_9CARY|nr:hypothetical protein Cgig2_026055 [Carnegiea gigantea]